MEIFYFFVSFKYLLSKKETLAARIKRENNCNFFVKPTEFKDKETKICYCNESGHVFFL